MQFSLLIQASEGGRERYGPEDVRYVIGRPFPVTDSHGKVVGEGKVVAASLAVGDRDLPFADPGGALLLRVYVEDSLEMIVKAMEFDVGRRVDRPVGTVTHVGSFTNGAGPA